jgi:hypothetical protein
MQVLAGEAKSALPCRIGIRSLPGMSDPAGRRSFLVGAAGLATAWLAGCGKRSEESPEASDAMNQDNPLDRVFPRLLAIVRGNPEPVSQWQRMLEVFRIELPAAPWARMPVPAIERDVDEAAAWLAAELKAQPAAKGIYLGLDTLNMEGGRGKNVEFGGTAECDPSNDDESWLEDDLDDGDDHLIRGLVEMHAEYSSPEWEAWFDFCDYATVLGYSGIVLAAAMARTAGARDLLVAWGFHDGDLFLLGRSLGGKWSPVED